MLFVVLLVLLLTVAVSTVIRNRILRGAALTATILHWAGLGIVLAGTAIALPRLLTERNPTWLIVFSGTASIVLASLPLVVRRGRGQFVMTWICALTLVALAAVFGLGGGAFMLPGALVLLFAAGLTPSYHAPPETV